MLEKTRDQKIREENKKKLMEMNLNSFEENATLNMHNINAEVMSLDDAFDDYKKEYQNSLEIIYPDIDPISSRVITSSRLMNAVEIQNQLTREELNLELFENLKSSVSDVQIVVAVGPGCRQVKKGDMVKIEMKDFMHVVNPGSVNRKEVFGLPMEKIDGVNYLTMHENNIKFIYKSKN